MGVEKREKEEREKRKEEIRVREEEEEEEGVSEGSTKMCLIYTPNYSL